MLQRRSPVLSVLGAVAAVTSVATAPALAEAATTTVVPSGVNNEVAQRRKLPYKGLEVQATMIGQLLPKPALGADAAFVFGTETFQFKFGATVLGSPAFRLAGGEIANVLGALTADVCVAKNVYRNQVRMCFGGQGGGMVHRWRGFERPGRRLTPWWAGQLEADYRYAVTDTLGILAGVGVVVPIVGPSFRAYDEFGGASQLILPGPLGGQLSLGTSWRF